MEEFLRPATYVLGVVLLGALIRMACDRFKVLGMFGRPFFRALMGFAVWCILPVVVFFSIARYSINEILGFGNAFLMAFISMGVCFIFAYLISHYRNYDRRTTVALVLNAAFMNVTHLGLSAVYALLGPDFLGPASLYAMGVGILNLVFGVALASSASKTRVSIGSLMETVVTFPAAFALIVAMLFVWFRAPVPDPLINIFDSHLTKPFFFLMLVVVGYQMTVVRPSKYLGMLTEIGFIRFVISPLVVILSVVALGLSFRSDLTPLPSLIQSVMPPAVFNIVLAVHYRLDTKLYSAMMFYSTLISLFIVLPIISILFL
ncbi:MAG: hypothetical protein QXG10_03015 [Candidatus Hadarchaeales archaeon]